MAWDVLIKHATIARMTTVADYGLIHNAAIAMVDGKIAWIGEMSDLPDISATHIVDAQGKLVTPGLIDCHTHLVYGGSRAGEFEQRLNGVSYETIAKQGGGILSTVTETRRASEDTLLANAKLRLQALAAEGVTSLEIKSGYGLDTDNEIKMLRVARQLDAQVPQSIRTTFLGAHALPPEYKGDADGYIDYLVHDTLPKVEEQHLADAVDVFCEGIGFSREQTRCMFDAAKRYHLPVKLHAEQLSNLEGAALVAEYDGLSADHLEYLSAEGVAAMAQKDVVAVLLPGAFYYLRETQLPPIDALRHADVPIAIATDMNPGSSPICSLLLMLNMACTCFKLTPAEAFAGITVNAAKALGFDDRGVLSEGKRADVLLWPCDHPAELSYQYGVYRPKHIFINGRLVSQ